MYSTFLRDLLELNSSVRIFSVGRACIYVWSCGLQGEAGHSVLLRSDGAAVACGDNCLGQCNIPGLVDGVTYTHVDTGTDHTVLLASDGTAVACCRTS